jgi:nuclear pore complex protein Nup98-Nup96
MFGAQPPQGSSLFGSPPPVQAYGAQPYGQQSAAPASYFGAPAALPQMPSAPPAGSIIPPAANEILTQQLTALDNQRKELEKMDVWRGRTQDNSAVVSTSLPESDAWNSVTPSRASYSPYRASPKSSVKMIRPRGFKSPEKTPTSSLSALGNGSRPMMTPDSVAASSVTRLVIKPSPKPRMKLLLDMPGESKASEQTPSRIAATAHNMSPSSEREQLPSSGTTPEGRTPNGYGGSEQRTASVPKSPGYDYYQQVISSPDEAAGYSVVKKSVAPTLSKAGYKCDPSIEVLQSMLGEDLAAVSGFSVERKGFGKIEWEGAVDVRGADLDRIAEIDQSTASMYMRDEQENKKPPVGSKLNRPAILTLLNVFPKNGGADSDEETKAKFSRRVETSTSKMGAQFVSYDSSSGEWKMRVQHFSKYGLDDDESDDEMEERAVNFESGVSGGLTPVKTKGILRKATPYKPSTTQVMEDEEMEEEDAALVSDMEVTDESKALEDAEAAYMSIYQTVNSRASSPLMEQTKEESAFPDEGEDAAETVPKSRFVPSESDFLSATSMSTSGICAKIAAGAGIKSSSTDFGVRLGRSCRVGWSPDGSFLSFGPNNGTLVRRRPVFAEESGQNELALLRTHQTHSQKDGSALAGPHFSLPQGGQTEDKDLQNALESYANGSQSDDMRVDQDSNETSVAKRAFSLLSCMLCSKEKNGSDELVSVGGFEPPPEYFPEERRTGAVSQWLVESCSSEVDNEIKVSMERKDRDSAVLAAVSGGDVEKACNTASSLGLMQLAGMLSAGPQGRGDILKEVQTWTNSGAVSKIPDKLIRIYHVIGGDPAMEEEYYKKGEKSFDWRRRLAMRLSYNDSEILSSPAALIEEYESKLASGVVPYPRPQYMNMKSRDEIQCILYRLLRLGNPALAIPLPEVIDPLGHTCFVHDFSLSFHLAAAISAMGICSPLSPIEEQYLVDGYMAQLASKGNWDWAVYVSLCSLAPSSPNSSRWKMDRAKKMVLQYYQEGDPSAIGKRRFLQRVGLPSDWFEEALANRCATNGDVYGCLTHMATYDPQEACSILEQVIVPNMLFMSKSKVQESLQLLEVFSAEEGSLTSALFDLFQVYQNILQLEGAGRAEIEAAIPLLFETCDSVEEIFAAYRSGEEKLRGPALRIIPDTKVVALSSFLAEALAQISLFKLQIKALEAGVSTSNIASHLMNLTSSNDFKDSAGMSSRDNMLRWLM